MSALTSQTLTAGKLCIVIFAAWGGDNGGIVAGLAVCTIMQTIVGVCADLMQDFKTALLVSTQILPSDDCALIIRKCQLWLDTGSHLSPYNGLSHFGRAPLFPKAAVPPSLLALLHQVLKAYF